MATKKDDKKEGATELKSALDQISKLKKQMKTMGEESEATKKYMEGTSSVLNAIAADPELKKGVQDKLGLSGDGKDGDDGKGTSPLPADPQVTQRIDKMEAGQREKSIKEFEKRVGIDKLKPEEQKDARQKIEQHLQLYGSSIGKVPIEKIDSVLDSTFKSVNVDKQIADGKAEGAAQARQNAQGTMGSIAGGAPDTTEEGKLTPEQAKWADKLGVDPEAAAKGVAEKDNEKTRLTKSEVKAKKELEE